MLGNSRQTANNVPTAGDVDDDGCVQGERTTVIQRVLALNSGKYLPAIVVWI